ncbi:PEP-CTERM sorting domain-containing protein [Roseateles violae]|uniref:PEP-CTERM sorting domain-containing protein n=1 Tax=Roseateles violae TaxID=3058042 RepID=A0ABT8DYA8_9BURK|nr:PEP-CTERM sorting domain-containing protein [Pelomonas sp. PFR6]MDN3922201.1 PEP-CTERM sorting domain-containing protein [Pelomonas sp. PFR6]
MRMTFGLPLRHGAVLAAVLLACQAAPALAQSTSILFIGNSFTYGDPAGAAPDVMFYKPSSVTDLNGSGIGGVPALFKQMTVDRGLNYDVSLETQPGSNLDFHFDNRLALINQPWDKVVMHGQSNLDFANPGNPAKISTWTHILGKVFQSSNPDVDISLTSTWSRANLTYQPACNSASPPSPWCGGDIHQMAIDVQKGYQVAMNQNSDIVSRLNPVGLAWNNAFDAGFADSNPYDGISAGQVNLWAPDSYHASNYGYYLHALVVFGEITGQSPTVLGFDTAAMDLGFTAQQAMAMQGFAAAAIAAVPEPSSYLMLLLGGGVVAWAAKRRRADQRQPDEAATA